MFAIKIPERTDVGCVCELGNTADLTSGRKVLAIYIHFARWPFSRAWFCGVSRGIKIKSFADSRISWRDDSSSAAQGIP